MQKLTRGFTPDDYSAVVAVFNAAWQGAPTSVEQMLAEDEMIRYHPENRLQRYVVEQAGAIIAFVCYDQPPRFYEPNRFRVSICVVPRYQGQGIGSSLYERILDDLCNLSTFSLWVKLREDMLSGIHFASKRGLQEELRINELYLDLANFDPMPYVEINADLMTQDIEIKTLQELESDSECYRKLYALTVEVCQDLPPTEHWVQPDFTDFLRETIARSPESYFVAVHNNSYIGMSYLSVRKLERQCRIALTGVQHVYRRRGVALALKLRGIAYAQSQECISMHTSVDSANQASLAMNKRLGFVQQAAWIVFSADLRGAVAVL